MISVKNYEEKSKTNFPALHFRGNGGHLGCFGTRQGTYTFKTAGSNAVKSCTHIEDISIYKVMKVLLLCPFACVLGCLGVCLCVSPFLASCSSVWAAAICCTDKCIGTTMKVYIAMNNRHIECIREHIDFIHVYISEAGKSLHYRSPKETQDSGHQTLSIVTSRWWHLSHIVHHSIEWCASVFLSAVLFTQSRY